MVATGIPIIAPVDKVLDEPDAGAAAGTTDGANEDGAAVGVNVNVEKSAKMSRK